MLSKIKVEESGDIGSDGMNVIFACEEETNLLPSLTSTKRFEKFKPNAEILQKEIGNIKKEIKFQEKLLTKVSLLEKEQSEIRKVLNEVLLKQSSNAAIDSINCVETNGDDDIYESSDSESDNEVKNERIRLPCRASMNSMNEIQQIHRERMGSIINSNLHYKKKLGVQQNIENKDRKHSLRVEISGFKSLLKQVQRDQDRELSTSMEYDRSLSMLKMEVMKLQRELCSCLKEENIKRIENSIELKRKEIKTYVEDFIIKFREETNLNAKMNFAKLESWVSDHETFSNRRQSKLEGIVSSCAKKGDLNMLHDNMIMDNDKVWKKINKIDTFVGNSHVSIESVKDFIAVTKIKNCFFNLRRNKLTLGWSIWKHFLRAQQELKITSISRLRSMRKVIKHQICGILRLGFISWKDFVRYSRYVTERKTKAGKKVETGMRKLIYGTRDSAFRKWRCMSVMYKIDLYENKETSEEGTNANYSEREISITTAISSFDKDIQSAVLFLAREIEKVKNKDIKKLREDWEIECDITLQRNEENHANIMKSINQRSTVFDLKVNDRIESMASTLSDFKMKLESQQNSLDETQIKLRRIEEIHGRKIDILHEHKESVEHRGHNLKCTLEQAREDIELLSKNHELSLIKISALEKNFRSLKDDNSEAKQDLLDSKSKIECHWDKNQSAFAQYEDRTSKAEAAISVTREDAENFRTMSSSKLMKINEVIYAPGIPKPELDKIAQNCILYELKAKEKNYAPSLNSMEEKDGINIADYMAAFAYDYSAWIAYEADRGSILKVINGANIDALTYADDDIETRRISLLEK